MRFLFSSINFTMFFWSDSNSEAKLQKIPHPATIFLKNFSQKTVGTRAARPYKPGNYPLLFY